MQRTPPPLAASVISWNITNTLKWIIRTGKNTRKKHKQSWSVHISVQSLSVHICMTWVWPQNFSHHTNNISFVCLCHLRNSNPIMFKWINPLDTGRKLNVHKTFRRSPGRLLNVLCTFNLRPVSTGKNWVNHNNYHS